MEIGSNRSSYPGKDKDKGPINIHSFFPSAFAITYFAEMRLIPVQFHRFSLMSFSFFPDEINFKFLKSLKSPSIRVFLSSLE